jgi:hypothetical protein
MSTRDTGRGEKAGQKPVRSAEQQRGSAAFTEVMRAWEELADEERLAWSMEGKDHRTSGVRHFKRINIRRLRRGEQLARVPPPSKPYDGRPLLKRLLIQNRHGRLILKLELRRSPTAPTTVWGARPCNRGLARPDKCPRLGWLPAPKRRQSEITDLYFAKHGDHIRNSRVPLTGKRIFIRVRQEVDSGMSLFEQVMAVVPGPEWRPEL